MQLSKINGRNETSDEFFGGLDVCSVVSFSRPVSGWEESQTDPKPTLCDFKGSFPILLRIF